MNMVSFGKVGKTVVKTAGAINVPGLLVKVGVTLAIEIVMNIAAKKLDEKKEKNGALYSA